MDKQKMFRPEEPRYITKGISDSLPVPYQVLLWHMIDNLRDNGKKLDYLQVFEIRTETSTDGRLKTLAVTHSQEQPKYKMQYVFFVNLDSDSVNGKIYVIDDTNYATMLWADEH